MSCCLSGCWRNSCIGACPSPPLWMKLLSTLWVGLHSTLWIELLSPLWEELLSSTTGLAGLPRTQETKGQQQWGEGGVPWNTEDPASEAEWGGAVLSSWTGRLPRRAPTHLSGTSSSAACEFLIILLTPASPVTFGCIYKIPYFFHQRSSTKVVFLQKYV